LGSLSVTGGGIEFRSDDGRGIWPSGEASESNSPQARQVPIPLLGFARRRATAARKNTAAAKAAGTGDGMDIEWTAVGAVLVAGALLVGFPVGIAVGYAWRDRISRARRIRFLAEQERRRTELDGVTTAFARPNGLRGKPVSEIATARSSLSERVSQTDVSKATISRVRKKPAGPNDPIAKRTEKDSKRRNISTALKVMTGDVLQEPAPNGTSME
jgi:hypothetical protein